MKKAHYDTYDYPSYWKGRDYEHESEVIALKKFLKLIPSIDSIADIGAGYGRLTPYYSKKANKIFLLEPSSSLLTIAKGANYKGKKVELINSSIENADMHLKPNSLDAVLMVRVMHHLKDAKGGIQMLSKILKKRGFLILEFANKIHGKAVIKNMCCGDFTFPHDLETTDRRCIENKATEAIPFYNYHPEVILEALNENGFEVIKKLSVSNVRNGSIKKHVPFKTLLKVENLLQNYLSGIYFGPSIFILAQKRG